MRDISPKHSLCLSWRRQRYKTEQKYHLMRKEGKKAAESDNNIHLHFSRDFTFLFILPSFLHLIPTHLQYALLTRDTKRGALSRIYHTHTRSHTNCIQTPCYLRNQSRIICLGTARKKERGYDDDDEEEEGKFF